MLSLTHKATKAASLLITDPPLFTRHIKQYFVKPRSGPIRLNGVTFQVDLELDPVMKRMFYGLYQLELAHLMKKFLTKGSGMLDIGANVGYFTAVAMGLVGRTGEVHAFEPVPRYSDRLDLLARDNPGYKLFVNRSALGETSGSAPIAVTRLRNIGWNTMVPGFMPEDTVDQTITVPVTTLDAYFATRPIPNLKFVKIDTEGYELLIIKGFANTVKSLGTRPVMVIEIAPTAYPRLGTSVQEIATLMQSLGYTARSMDLQNTVDVSRLSVTTDVAFIPL